ncbi:MAG: hypothetical protein HY651_12390 [Acidobacteria bacterium]|nr:hypothetical protein [Acidobacteriota bacterium]
MPLKPGTMLGPYEIVAQIGAGVYPSRDSNGAVVRVGSPPLARARGSD